MRVNLERKKREAKENNVKKKIKKKCARHVLHDKLTITQLLCYTHNAVSNNSMATCWTGSS